MCLQVDGWLILYLCNFGDYVSNRVVVLDEKRFLKWWASYFNIFEHGFPFCAVSWKSATFSLELSIDNFQSVPDIFKDVCDEAASAAFCHLYKPEMKRSWHMMVSKTCFNKSSDKLSTGDFKTRMNFSSSWRGMSHETNRLAAPPRDSAIHPKVLNISRSSEMRVWKEDGVLVLYKNAWFLWNHTDLSRLWWRKEVCDWTGTLFARWNPFLPWCTKRAHTRGFVAAYSYKPDSHSKTVPVVHSCDLFVVKPHQVWELKSLARRCRWMIVSHPLHDQTDHKFSFHTFDFSARSNCELDPSNGCCQQLFDSELSGWCARPPDKAQSVNTFMGSMNSSLYWVVLLCFAGVKTFTQRGKHDTDVGETNTTQREFHCTESSEAWAHSRLLFVCENRFWKKGNPSQVGIPPCASKPSALFHRFSACWANNSRPSQCLLESKRSNHRICGECKRKHIWRSHTCPILLRMCVVLRSQITISVHQYGCHVVWKVNCVGSKGWLQVELLRCWINQNKQVSLLQGNLQPFKRS